MGTRTLPEYGHHDSRVLHLLQWERGLSASEMSDVLGYSEGAIKRAFRNFAVEHRSAVEERKRQGRSPWSDIVWELKRGEGSEIPDPPTN